MQYGRVFFVQFELADAKYDLDVGSGTRGEQTGKMLTGIEDILSYGNYVWLRRFR